MTGSVLTGWMGVAWGLAASGWTDLDVTISCAIKVLGGLPPEGGAPADLDVTISCAVEVLGGLPPEGGAPAGLDVTI